MKKHLILFSLFLIFVSCERGWIRNLISSEEEIADTIGPTVVISSHTSGQTVFDIITLTVDTDDDGGISKVEFFIDDSLVLTDTESPYQYDWNTTQYESNSEHIIKVISYDNSGNSTVSQSILLTVDHTSSLPNGGNITSVTYTLTEMTVEWEGSTDGDFNDYKVLYSDTENGDRDTLETYTDKSTTSHSITEFDPLVENWFWVQVTDTLGLSSIGSGMTNSLDNVPNPVNVTSVTYDLESMTIIWEDYVPNLSRINQMNQNTRSTVTNDFVSYELLKSDTEDGNYTSVVVITDQTTTSHSLIEYSPLQENWFKVKVTDYWNLTSTGNGMTNEIDSPPTQIDISSITYDLSEMVISWELSSDNDFVSYELLQSDSENGTYSSVVVTTDQSTTSHSITEFDPLVENWFKVKVTDFWNLTSTGSGMTNEIESTPPIPSVLYPITYNDGFQISWSQNDDDDFQSYKLYESLSEDMSNDTLIYETDDRTDTTYFKTIQNFRYYQIVVEDFWGFHSTSNIEVGDYEVELWGQSYSVLNTTELDLFSSGLTGSIPPEIGNLTNLIYLNLSQNQLTGSIPSEIGNLTNLTSLNLNYNQLTGEIPPEIGNLTNLTAVNFFFNQLIGSIPSEIGNLTNLNYFNLESNQLTGEIPSEIGNLTNLNYFNLYGNQLIGSIPSQIGNLTNLERLDLGDNELTGSIPSQIGNLTNLNYLILESNQLSGEIPESICDLNINWSINFYISNNQLCPPYPSCIEDYVGEQDTSDCP